jgi:hypothetical protein
MFSSGNQTEYQLHCFGDVCCQIFYSIFKDNTINIYMLMMDTTGSLQVLVEHPRHTVKVGFMDKAISNRRSLYPSFTEFSTTFSPNISFLSNNVL